MTERPMTPPTVPPIIGPRCCGESELPDPPALVLRVADGRIATGGKVDVTVCMTGVTTPSGWVDLDSDTITVGGGVLKDVVDVDVVVVVVGSEVTGGVGSLVESSDCVQEVPKSVVSCEDVTGTVIVTVSTEVVVSPSVTCELKVLQ